MSQWSRVALSFAPVMPRHLSRETDGETASHSRRGLANPTQTLQSVDPLRLGAPDLRHDGVRDDAGAAEHVHEARVETGDRSEDARLQ